VKNQQFGTPLFHFKNYFEYQDENKNPHDLQDFKLSTIPDIADAQSKLLTDISDYLIKRIDTNGKINTN
jgi:hypothetical protein